MYFESELFLDVRYYETDQMGIIHHSNYIRYFECGRDKFLRDLKIPVTEVEKMGYYLPVVNVVCNYHKRTLMGDTLRIVTYINEVPTARMRVFSDVYNQRGDKVCDGYVTIGFLNRNTGRPSRIPEFLLDILNANSKD